MLKEIDKIFDKLNDAREKQIKLLFELRRTRANLNSAIEISSNKSVIALLKVTLKDIEKSLEENNVV